MSYVRSSSTVGRWLSGWPQWRRRDRDCMVSDVKRRQNNGQSHRRHTHPTTVGVVDFTARRHASACTSYMALCLSVYINLYSPKIR